VAAQKQNRWLVICLLLGLTGCIQMPADVAAELNAPDGSSINHYRLQDASDKEPGATAAAKVKQ
jgi:starvation-inducible outer membrane lipoprotein